MNHTIQPRLAGTLAGSIPPADSADKAPKAYQVSDELSALISAADAIEYEVIQIELRLGGVTRPELPSAEAECAVAVELVPLADAIRAQRYRIAAASCRLQSLTSRIEL